VNKQDAALFLRRLKVLWPRELPEGTDAEWLRVLAPLEASYADMALNEMRDTLMFPPTVADFRSAYYLALSLPTDTLALPAGDESGSESLRDVYGENQREWVYCWRCDMALSLEERDSAKLSGYDASRGLYHHRCPKKGAAPSITAKERAERNEYYDKHRIAVGPNVDPVPYTGG
jgi:hypothetical protein